MSSIPNPAVQPQRPAGAPVRQSADDVRQALHQHLKKTASFIKFMDALVSIFAWLAGMLLIWLTACVVDHWLWPLPSWGRWLFWGLGIAASVWWLGWQLVPLVVRRINPVYAARRIEHLVPEFKNGLISWLELEKLPENGVPRGVMAALAFRAARFIGGQDPSATVDTSPLIKIIGGVLLLSTGLVLYTMLSPKSTFVTGERILFPWKTVSAPTRVQIVEVQPGAIELTQGRPLELSVAVKGLRRDEPVFARFSTIDGQLEDQRVTLVSTTEGFRYTGQVTTDSQGVQQPLDYWIEAGDAVSGPFRVSLSPLPSVVLQSVELRFPAYTQLEPRSVSGDKIEAVEGTRAVIQAHSNQPLSRGRLEINPSVDAAGELVRAQEIVDMQIEQRQLQATLTLELDEAKSNPTKLEYRIRGYNQRGDANPRPITHALNVLADVPPEVTLVGPESRVLRVRANSRINLEIRASDPDFGLTRLSLAPSRNGIPAADITLLKSEEGIRGRQVKTYSIELAKSRAAVGEWFEVVATAADNRHDPRSQTLSPNIARSQPLVLHVVGPEEAADVPDSTAKPEREPKPTPQNQADKNPDAAASSNQPPSANNGSGVNSSEAGKQPPAAPAESSKPSPQSENQPAENQSSENQSSQNQQPGAEGSGGSGSQSEQESGGEGQPQPGGSGSSAGGQGTAGEDQQSGGSGNASRGGAGAQSESANSSSQNSGSGGKGGSTGQGAAEAANGGESAGSDTPSGNGAAGQSGSTSDSSSGSRSPAGNQPGNDGEAFQRVSEYLKSQPQPTDGNTNGGQGQSAPAGASNSTASDSPPAGASDDQPSANSQGTNSKSQAEQGGQRANASEAPAAGDEQNASRSDSPNSAAAAGNQKASSAGDAASQTQPQTGNPSAANGQTQPQGSQSPEAGSDSSRGSRSPADNSPADDSKGANGSQSADATAGNAEAADASSARGGAAGSEASQNQKSSGGKDSNGKSSDGKSATEQSSGGKSSDGESADGKSSDGKSSDGKSSDGKSSDGQGADGKSADGKGADGQQSKGANGSSAAEASPAAEAGAEAANSDTASQSQSGESQSTESQSGESQSGESQSAESQSAESPPNDSQSSNSKSPDSQSPAEGKSSPTDASQSSGSQSSGAQSSGAQSSGAQSSGSQEPTADGSKGKSQKSSGRGSSKASATGSGVGTQGGEGGSSGQRDATNRQYAEQTTQMVLDYLNRQKDQPDPELLRELDWTPQDLQRFVERWNQARDLANSSDPAERKKWAQMLEELNLLPADQQLRQGSDRNDAFQQQRDSGGRLRVPASLQKQFDAYRNAIEQAR